MRRVVKLMAFLIAAIAVIARAGPARADDYAELDKARNSYNAGRYEESAERFGALVDPASETRIKDAFLLERARTYLAASLIALGRKEEADVVIEDILRQNPAAVPDPIFPTPVLDRFTDARARIREELEQKAREKARAEQEKLQREEEKKRLERERIKQLERLAAEEVHVVHHSRWIAALPFGAGQLQNDQPALGWTLLGVEAALAGTALAGSLIVQSLQSQGTRPNVDRADLNDRIATWKQINNLSAIGFAAVAAGGVVHAQLTFVPERRETRRRAVPAGLSVVPTAGPLERGAVLGIRGVF